MKSIADQLPPEISRQLHPDRRKNEAEYWLAAATNCSRKVPAACGSALRIAR